MDFEDNPPIFIIERVKAIVWNEFKEDLIERKGLNEYKNLKISEPKKIKKQREEYYLKNYNKRLEEYLSTYTTTILDKEVDELSKKLYDNQDFIGDLE